MRCGGAVTSKPRVVELGEEVIDGFGGLVHLLPKRGGGAFVGVGAADGSLERVGHGLEQDRVLILRLLAGEEGNLAARAAEHLAAIGNDVRAFSPGRTPMWAVTVALP